jgi:hypothetical protein
MGYLKAKEKLGLSIDETGTARFHSPWFRYLDEHADTAPDVFNYVDIFFNACELKGTKEWKLKSTDVGRESVERLKLASEYVVCQVFTSDAKKNWSLSSWFKFVKDFHARQPGYDIVLLGAPNEEVRIDELRLSLAMDGVSVKKAILNLDGALALLDGAKLLLTGDTSIKHLANATSVRVLEISLGSSDWQRTGIYKEDSLILSTRVDCAPCPHSSPCSKTTHLCEEKITPATVVACAESLLQKNWENLTAIARQHKKFLSVRRTKILANGFWFAFELGNEEVKQAVDQLLNRCTWKLLLNQGAGKNFLELGSECLKLKTELKEAFPLCPQPSLLGHLNFLESDLLRKQEQAGFAKNAFARSRKAEAAETDFTKLRQVQTQLDQKSSRTEIKISLVRSLKNQMSEME